MLIEVTQEDIDNGSPGKAGLCPIALAMSRSTGKQWRVANLTCFCPEEWPWDDILLPLEAVQFVKAYDSGDGVEPFSFALDDPEIACCRVIRGAK